MVSLSFYQFEPNFSDEDKVERMVAQIDEGAKAGAETIAATAQAVTGSVAVGAAVGQLLLAGALSQIWGMINGM